MALKAAGRGLGLIRTVVLARLLLPEDFGLLGIALLTIGIVETCSSTGFKSALIQKKESIVEYLDSAWTASAVRGIFLSVLLCMTAPFVAEFFQTPEAIPVIRVIAATVLMSGFRNIGMVYFERDLEFHKQFIYEIAANLINLIVSIILAFHLRSVWALVWGGLSADIFRLFFSYFIHPYVPKLRIELKKVIDLFRFGKWVFLSGMLVFLITQGDDLFVAKFLGISALAYYQMAFMVSNLPTTEISHVISNVTFPAYSKMQNDVKRLRAAYLRVLQLTALVSLPLTGLIFSLSQELTSTVLGSKWMPIVPLIRILSLAGLLRAIAATTGPVLQGVGAPKLDTVWQVVRLFILAVAIYPMTLRWGLSGISMAVLLSIFITTVGFCWMVIRVIGCRGYDFFKSLIVPLVSTLAMILLIGWIKSQIAFPNPWQLAFLSICGILTYQLSVVTIDQLFKIGITGLLKESLKTF